MTIIYQVGECVDLLREAARASGPQRSMLIFKAKELIDSLDLMQYADLSDEVRKMTPKELRMVMAVGPPKQIYNQAAKMLAGQEPIENA